MESSTYKIRKSFLLPMGLVVLFSAILLISTLYLGLPTAKVIILVVFLLPVCLLFAESSRRKAIISNEAIEVHKLLRSKRINYAELTDVDTIQMRKRVFVSLSSENDFLILSNSYDRFGDMLREIISRVPDSIVSDKAKQLADVPPKKCSDIFSAWLAVAVLVLIICVQIREIL